jgi:hypothetical protein
MTDALATTPVRPADRSGRSGGTGRPIPIDARSSRELSRRLNAEWARLSHRPAAVDAARRWHVTERPFDDLGQLLVIAGHRQPTTPAADEVLRRLLVEAQRDQLAGRVVLQRILPGLLGTVRRRAAGAGVSGLLEELVGAAWIAIRSYDPTRRPSSLAAALVWSAEHRAFRPSKRTRPDVERPVDPTVELDVPWRPAVSPCDELARVLADASAAGVADEDLAFVRHLVRTGSPGQVARELDVTPRTVRNRRDAITYRVRRAVVAA